MHRGEKYQYLRNSQQYYCLRDIDSKKLDHGLAIAISRCTNRRHLICIRNPIRRILHYPSVDTLGPDDRA